VLSVGIQGLINILKLRIEENWVLRRCPACRGTGKLYGGVDPGNQPRWIECPDCRPEELPVV
jgi:hypothetical protein